MDKTNLIAILKGLYELLHLVIAIQISCPYGVNKSGAGIVCISGHKFFKELICAHGHDKAVLAKIMVIVNTANSIKAEISGSNITSYNVKNLLLIIVADLRCCANDPAQRKHCRDHIIALCTSEGNKKTAKAVLSWSNKWWAFRDSNPGHPD